jgi:hypothetical protein
LRGGRMTSTASSRTRGSMRTQPTLTHDGCIAHD